MKRLCNFFVPATAMLALALLPIDLRAAGLLFERSPYGLLFAHITVDGHAARAMIDFGDPYALQLASSFLAEHGLEALPSGKRAQYVDGTEFDLLEGTANNVVIGGVTLERVTFGSAPGEIDAVSAQVDTPFNATVGWGFFRSRRFLLDYAAGTMRLELAACPADADAVVYRRDEADYLIISGRIGARSVNFMVDTGSPVNVLDQALLAGIEAPGTPRTIEHVTGPREGIGLPLSIGAWHGDERFEAGDLNALEPLGVQGILGADFLADVRLCYEPAGPAEAPPGPHESSSTPAT